MLEPRRIELARLPSPLVRLDRLGEALGGAQIWVKRDDLTGLELSGNKVRKLEYVLADAQAAGCDTVVTEGTPQSNHCRATAAACTKLGLQAMLLFRPESPALPQGNHLLDTLFGAETRSYSRPDYAARREQIVSEVLAELRASGRRPRWTPAGASEPLGCWGYIRMMGELADQLRETGLGSCDIVVAVSSGGTYAGTWLGQRLHGLENCGLSAVPVSHDVAYHTGNVGDLIRSAIELYDIPAVFEPARLQFIDGYVGEGYAIPYQAAIETIRLVARLEAVMLDPVYTAKAFCAVLDGVREGRLGRQRPVVFVHTGGIFSDFAWPEELLGA